VVSRSRARSATGSMPVRCSGINAASGSNYSDTVHRDGELMAVALLSWELEDLGDRTRVSVIDQVTSLVGPGMIDGHRNGHNTTLDQLADYLSTQQR